MRMCKKDSSQVSMFRGQTNGAERTCTQMNMRVHVPDTNKPSHLTLTVDSLRKPKPHQIMFFP